MKKLLPIAMLLLVAPLVRGQEITPTRDGTERKFAGEVVSVDVPNKTLTTKASGVDAKGEPVERTVTLAVVDTLVERLGTLNPGDKITVLWRRDDATQRDTVIAFAKADQGPPDKQ